MTMASRAQQQLIILNKIVNLKDIDLCAEIENVIHTRSEEMWSENDIRGIYLLSLFDFKLYLNCKSSFAFKCFLIKFFQRVSS